MRIAVFIKATTFNKNYGGLETQNRILCEGLVSRGHEITIFSPVTKKEPQREETLNGIRYIFIPASYQYLFASLNSNSWERRSVEVFKKFHTEKHYDLVISQSTGGIGILKNKGELGVKAISIAHGTASGELKTFFQNVKSIKDLYWAVRNTQYFLRQYFGRQRDYILKADKVVAVSSAVKSQLLEETFVPEENLTVIHNGINPERFTQLVHEETSGPVRLIYTGRVVKSKGLFELLKVLSEIRENYYFEMVGGGEDLEDLRIKVEDLKLESKVRLLGKLSYEEAIKHLFNSDIFVLPSKRIEGFPMTLPEAMLASLPVVASSIGGIPDAIEDGKTGFLFKPEDWDVLREKILILIRDKDLREQMGKNGKIKAMRDFTLEVMLEKYEKIFQEVVR